MSYTYITGQRSNRYPLMGSMGDCGCGCGGSGGCGGMGQAENGNGGISKIASYASLAAIGLGLFYGITSPPQSGSRRSS